MTWHHLNYFLGLHHSGHNVYFIEDSGDYEECCYNPQLDITGKDPAYGLQYAFDVFERIGVPGKWAYYNKHENKWEGPVANDIFKIIDSADVLINVSLVNPIRSWLEKIPVRIAIDTDPVFTQIQNITIAEKRELTESHTHFFTFGENFGKEGCCIPDDGFKWLPTRQPIYLPEWKMKPPVPEGKWTTIMLWESYKSRELNGKKYGMKSISFDHLKDLPSLVKNMTLELAMGNNGPSKDFRSRGWSLVNPIDTSITPWRYKEYIESSKGEWSAAKHGYIISNSGWFSERSACYLATGRPVIVQETGFSKNISTGNGLLSFCNAEEAAHHLQFVSDSYINHCRSAREIAEAFFNSESILKELLNRV